MVETTAPVVNTFNPVDGAVGIATGANIVIVFSESVQRGAGSIVLTNTTNPADTRTIAVTDAAQIGISGATLTINPTADLLVGAHYALTMASGVIKDLAGNYFAGIASSTVLDFTTVTPSYALTATLASVDEGGAVTFSVATTNVAVNTVLNYTLSGAGITSADIGGAALTGTTTVAANGMASFTVNLTADQLTEGAETLTATVQGQTASVLVNDTSIVVVSSPRTKYFVLPSSTGANFTDFDLSYGAVTLTGEQVTFVGSSAVDALFVRPGVTVDFTLSGSGADKIYLGGSFANYTSSIAGSVMTLQRGTGATLESVNFIKSTSAISSDNVIFADGTLNSLDLYNNLKTATALPALSTAETSIAPLAPALAGSVLNASIKAFALYAGGDTFAPAKPGVAMTVVGSLGVDTVYVARGGVEDCTLLGSGQDLIYFNGNWGDYTKVISGSVLTFSRTVDGYNESVRVVGSSTNISLNDHLVFADGAVYSGDAKTALTASLTTAINAVTGYDATLVTPGVGTSLMSNALNGVTDLEVGSNIVLNYSANVSVVTGKYIHIVNDGGTGFHGESTVNTLNILVTDTAQVSIVGGKVTLNPTADLDLANNYHITIDAGAFTITSTGVALPAYDGTSALHFSTVTPGTTALVNAVASHIMNADGTLGSGHLWLDIEGIGSPSASAGTVLDLSANSYALVAKDYDAAGGSTLTGYDGVKTADFYVAANNFGNTDLLYIDNQGSAGNDLTQTLIIATNTPPSKVQFAGTGLGGFVDITLAGSTATFDTIAQMKTLLGTSTSPVISA
ncbi:MAG: Ig-like domain-containing protein [Betaproteobacteria bacterium]